jgi:tRNA dimethylallyltransferase
VARPSNEELNTVSHHFIATHSIYDDINAADFEKYALEKVNELFVIHEKIVMVGGTGLYIKAFCDGFDEIPDIEPEIRNAIVMNYSNGGIEWLKEQVEKSDPEFYIKGEIKNPQRMMRALEVKMSTGRSILSFHSGGKRKRNFNIIKIGLEIPKEELHSSINNRVDKMIGNGLVEEVKNLQPYKNLNALQTVGYSEIFEYLDNKVSLPEAIELIKKNTRQYAKRQLTWFRKDKDVKWFHPSGVKDMIEYIQTKK